MKSTIQTLKAEHSAWFRAMQAMSLLLLLVWGSGTASASNAPEDTWRYTVMLNGTKQLKLDMPVYDEDGYDSWIDDGYVYITIEGGQKETLFHYSSKDKSGDYPYSRCTGAWTARWCSPVIATTVA